MVLLWLVSVNNYIYYLTYLMTSSTLLVAVFIFYKNKKKTRFWKSRENVIFISLIKLHCYFISQENAEINTLPEEALDLHWFYPPIHTCNRFLKHDFSSILTRHWALSSCFQKQNFFAACLFQCWQFCHSLKKLTLYLLVRYKLWLW